MYVRLDFLETFYIMYVFEYCIVNIKVCAGISVEDRLLFLVGNQNNFFFLSNQNWTNEMNDIYLID